MVILSENYGKLDNVVNVSLDSAKGNMINFLINMKFKTNI